MGNASYPKPTPDTVKCVQTSLCSNMPLILAFIGMYSPIYHRNLTPKVHTIRPAHTLNTSPDGGEAACEAAVAERFPEALVTMSMEYAREGKVTL